MSALTSKLDGTVSTDNTQLPGTCDTFTTNTLNRAWARFIRVNHTGPEPLDTDLITLSRGSNGAAGYDVHFNLPLIFESCTTYSLNLSFKKDISIEPRSGLAFKQNLHFMESERIVHYGDMLYIRPRLLCNDKSTLELDDKQAAFQIIFNPKRDYHRSVIQGEPSQYPTIRSNSGFGSTDSVTHVNLNELDHYPNNVIYKVSDDSEFRIQSDLWGLIVVNKSTSITIKPRTHYINSLGLTMAMPKNYYYKVATIITGLVVMAGIVDADYRGDIKVKLWNDTDEDITIGVHEQFLELIPFTYEIM